LLKDLKIFVRKADLTTQVREGIAQANARLWFDRERKNRAYFGLGAAPMLSGSHPQCAVYIVRQIAYC
jgi:hypothetical protein